MQKVKWFLVANQEVSFGNVDMIQNRFAPFDRKMFGKSEEQLTSTDCWPTVGRQLADSQWRWAVLRFYQMFNVQTVNCMQCVLSTGCNSRIKLGRNHAMKWIQTQNTYFKNTMIYFNWREAIWSLMEKKENKETRKKN